MTKRIMSINLYYFYQKIIITFHAFFFSRAGPELIAFDSEICPGSRSDEIFQ